jgi:heptosyltransferase-3
MRQPPTSGCRSVTVLMISFSELREKAFKIPSPLARERFKVMGVSLRKSAWRVMLLRREARRTGRKVHFLFHPHHMGDIVAAEPLARSLVSHDRLLVWVVLRQFSDVLRHVPWVDAVLPITCLTEWLILQSVIPNLSVTMPRPEGDPCDWFRFVVKNPSASRITWENYYDFGSLLQVYSRCGIGRVINDRPRTYLDPSLMRETTAALLGLAQNARYVVFHCESADPARNWPGGHFSSVVDWLLRETTMNVVELGLSPVLKPHPRICQPQRSIRLDHQMSIIAGASLFVGVDSGFAHIANACEIPAVILMGKYKKWTVHMPFSGPWAEGVGCTIVRTAGALADLAPEEVIRAIRATLIHTKEKTEGPSNSQA